MVEAQTARMRCRLFPVACSVLCFSISAVCLLLSLKRSPEGADPLFLHSESRQHRPPRSLRARESLWNGIPRSDSGSANASSARSTPPDDGVNLSDVHITVKTTGAYHRTRLDVIMRTWYQMAKGSIYFYTDSADDEYQKKLNGHLINTNCSSSHNRKALCCKMSVEFDSFLDSNKRWMCHFDDDNYVNIPNLIKLLQKYNPQEDWYLGKPSIRKPLEIVSKDNTVKNISFWFATGGAGFCVSRSLALKMMPVSSGGKFVSIGEKIRLPDDVTMGYIIEHLLQKKLTVVDEFHSHLEPMKFLKRDEFRSQITFSYSTSGTEMNIIDIDGFDTKLDPTR